MIGSKIPEGEGLKADVAFDLKVFDGKKWNNADKNVLVLSVLTSSMRTPKPIIKQWCDPLMTFHKHCSCYSLLTLR